MHHAEKYVGELLHDVNDRVLVVVEAFGNEVVELFHRVRLVDVDVAVVLPEFLQGDVLQELLCPGYGHFQVFDHVRVLDGPDLLAGRGVHVREPFVEFHDVVGRFGELEGDFVAELRRYYKYESVL